MYGSWCTLNYIKNFIIHLSYKTNKDYLNYKKYTKWPIFRFELQKKEENS